MKRLLFFAVVLSVFIGLWVHFGKVSCKMVGLSSAIGPIQTVYEAPFFSKLSTKSNTSLTCQYVPINQQGIQEGYLLKYLERGFYDLAAIRFRLVESSDVAIAGMDLPGLPLELASSRNLSHQFSPFLEKILEEKFKVKIIDTFAFGPQELFCKKPIYKLEDFKGLKIRTAAGPNSMIAKLIAALGARPFQIEFANTITALQDNLVDCGVSSYLSAENAGWFQYLPYRMGFILGNGSNAYIINLKTWTALSARQKTALKSSIGDLTNDMWDFSQKSYEESLLPCSRDAVNCQKTPKLIKLSEAQMNRIYQFTIDEVLKPWLKSCDEVHPGCKAEWLKAAKATGRFENLSLSDL
jgi:TRAP-type transport system periplasmic protein